VDDGNSERIRFAAHTIKGACGTMFATRLAALALEIEQNNENIQAVRDLIPSLEACVRETMDWWATLEARPKD
jgi:HPt (histidine-containing phosphotransfer) domain-containing protein